jgi:hypothetical protein
MLISAEFPEHQAIPRARTAPGRDAEALADETWNATELLDKMGMLTIRRATKYALRLDPTTFKSPVCRIEAPANCSSCALVSRTTAESSVFFCLGHRQMILLTGARHNHCPEITGFCGNAEFSESHARRLTA